MHYAGYTYTMVKRAKQTSCGILLDGGEIATQVDSSLSNYFIMVVITYQPSG